MRGMKRGTPREREREREIEREREREKESERERKTNVEREEELERHIQQSDVVQERTDAARDSALAGALECLLDVGSCLFPARFRFRFQT